MVCQSHAIKTQITLVIFDNYAEISTSLFLLSSLNFTRLTMLRFQFLQKTSKQISLLSKIRPYNNRLVSTVRKVSTTTTCLSLQRQKVNYTLALWKASGVVAAAALTYGLTNTNVLALEANDCNTF